MERIESKIRAKELLKGRWGNAVGATLVFGVVPYIISFLLNFAIPFLGLIICWLFSTYMILCFNKYCVKLTKEEGKVKYGECFLDASIFFKILGAQILVAIAIFIIIMVCEFLGYYLGIIILILSNIIVCILSILCALIFFTVPFIFIENSEIGVVDGIKKAMNISKGFKWKYFVFLLSFIGWSILASLFLGIGWLWLKPYLVLSTFLFYKHMAGEYDKVGL